MGNSVSLICLFFQENIKKKDKWCFQPQSLQTWVCFSQFRIAWGSCQEAGCDSVGLGARESAFLTSARVALSHHACSGHAAPRASAEDNSSSPALRRDAFWKHNEKTQMSYFITYDAEYRSSRGNVIALIVLKPFSLQKHTRMTNWGNTDVLYYTQRVTSQPH